MTADKNKTLLLIVVLIVGGLTYHRMIGFETVTAPATVAKAASPPEAVQDAKIRIDLLEFSLPDNVGKKNLFQYQQRQSPAKPSDTPRGLSSISITNLEGAPVSPSVPSFGPFRYEGFSLTKETRKILASVSDGRSSYQLEQGEYLLGRYWVTRITESLVEIEDIQQKSRRTFVISQ
jgi:hypothetical protein